MAADIAKLLKTFQQLEAQSSSFRSTCDDIEKYIMPRVGGTATQHATKDEGSATWKDPDVWDFTAPVALAKLAAHIHTSVMPPGLRWGSFAWQDEELQKDEECAKALELRTDLVFHALEESDFDAEMSAAFPEYVGLGNMVIVQEVAEAKPGEWGGLDFTAVPDSEVEFEEDSKGQMKTFFRHLRWTAVQILDKCGDKTPADYREKAAQPNGSSELHDVIFCIFERPEILRQAKRDMVAAPERRPYGYVYFDKKGQQLGDEGGYYDFPAFIGRWGRTPGSRWGHGLGHIALPHVKGLNAFVELVLTAHALAVDPPSKVTERGLMSDVHREPGGLTVVESMEDMAPLEPPGKRLDIGAVTLEEQRLEVRRLFHEDQLTLKDSPQMSATEAQIRYDIMLKLLGPVIARLISECVNPLLMGAYRALVRADRFPPLPRKALEKNAELRIVYRGALARSRRTDEVASIERTAASAANMLKMGFEEIRDVFKPDMALRKIAELLEVPAGVVATEADAAQARKARLAMQQRMAEAQAAKDESTAAANVAKARQANGEQLPPAAAGALPIAPQPALTPAGQVV
jgi:hypothetical protein